MKFIGKKAYSFADKDGRQVEGVSFHFIEPLEKGEGMGGVKHNMSPEKAAALAYTPAIGDEVTVLYNRYGKADAFIKQK